MRARAYTCMYGAVPTSPPSLAAPASRRPTPWIHACMHVRMRARMHLVWPPLKAADLPTHAPRDSILTPRQTTQGTEQ